MTKSKLYVDATEIADIWNKEKFPYKKGKELTTWKGDDVARCFRRIMEKIDEPSLNMTFGEEEAKWNIRDIYHIDRVGKLVFLDAGEIIRRVEKTREANLGDFFAIEPEPDYYELYGQRTSDALKRIFQIWYGSNRGYFTYEEYEEFENLLIQIVPWYKNQYVLLGDIYSVKDAEMWQSQLEFLYKCQDYIRQVIWRFYIKTRNGTFYNLRIFVKSKYVKNGQYEMLNLWHDKWNYIMLQVVVIRKREEEKDDFKIEDLLRTMTVWYCCMMQDERFESDTINDYEHSLGEFKAKCRKYITEIVDHELKEINKNDYEFLLVTAFKELEGIHNTVLSGKGKDYAPNKRGYLDWVASSISMLHSEKIKRWNFVEEKVVYR